MTKKELLRKQIEEERQKLNAVFAGGGKVEDAYEQAKVMDRLFELYIEQECGGL